MKKLLLTLFLACGAAQAEWMEIGSSPQFTLYADTVIKFKNKDKNLPTEWLLFEFKKPKTYSSLKKAFHSSISKEEVRCAEEESRTVSNTLYEGRMGKGVVIFTDELSTNWHPTNMPKTISSIIYGHFCRQPEGE